MGSNGASPQADKSFAAYRKHIIAAFLSDLWPQPGRAAWVPMLSAPLTSAPCLSADAHVQVSRPWGVLPLLESVALAFVLRLLPGWTLLCAQYPWKVLPRPPKAQCGRMGPTRVISSLGLPRPEQVACVLHNLEPDRLVVVCSIQAARVIMDRMPDLWGTAHSDIPCAILYTNWLGPAAPKGHPPLGHAFSHPGSPQPEPSQTGGDEGRPL